MLLPVSTVTALCVLLDAAQATTLTDQEMEDTFRGRSQADWEHAWHRESHSRCRERLIRHLYWACEKDIYRLYRRDRRSEQSEQGFPFVGPQDARELVRFRRDQRRRSPASITSECCLNSAGCTWEEYAEYCPTNKRVRKLDYVSYVK